MPTSKNITKLGKEVQIGKYDTGKWMINGKNKRGYSVITTQQAKDRGFINPAKRKIGLGYAKGMQSALGLTGNWKKRLGLR